MIVCDFCSSPDVLWTYPAHDTVPITVTGKSARIILESVGHWAACQHCHDLIERELWNDLLERSISYCPPGLRDSPASILRDAIGAIHAAFRTARFGSPRRV